MHYEKEWTTVDEEDDEKEEVAEEEVEDQSYFIFITFLDKIT